MPLILREIWIYPIKAFGGISLSEATAGEKGLACDRRWMLVDENNRFITQREVPVLALSRLTASTDGFRVHLKGGHLDFPKVIDEGEELNATIFDDEVVVLEWSKEASQWLSMQLGTTCKLVHFPELKPRRVDPNYVTEDVNVSLADGYPYLVIGEGSLENLNQKLPKPVSMRRFRPNFVFDGGEPFAEDLWGDVTIGSVKFRGAKTCGRCVVTTNDNGRLGKEPLATLAKYRKFGDRVCFGMNLICKGKGIVRVGDEIFVETFARPNGFKV